MGEGYKSDTGIHVHLLLMLCHGNGCVVNGMLDITVD